MCVLLRCLLLCAVLALGTYFLLSYGTPQQTSKQEENKHGVGGCLIQLQLQLHYYAPPLSGTSIGRRHLGIGCFERSNFPGCFPEP